MSSVKLPAHKDPADAAGPVITESFFRQLASFLALDALVFFGFSGSLWMWIVLTGVEAVFLVFNVWRSSRLLRQTLAPLSTLTEAAESLKESALDANELRRLARKLERVDAQSMAQRVATSGGGKELGALADAINDMLQRIDQRYQAQVRFTSDASHELRTPISVIQGYANLLNRWGKDNPQIRQEAIDAIRQEADAMGTLVEQLLFLVRGDNETQKVTMEPVDLTELATAVARETAMVAQTHQVASDISAHVTAVADRNMIKECLRVLCDNAVKYTPAGGSITVGLRQEAGTALLSVTDTGAGIAQADLPRVFERFYRTDDSRARSTGGTGLGLAIAAWIAARHGGRIDVSSKLGLGSRFTLVLPLTPPEPEK